MDVFTRQPETPGSAPGRLPVKAAGLASAARPTSAPPVRRPWADPNISTENGADVVILSALPEEHDALVEVFGCASGFGGHGRRTWTAEVAGYRIAVESLRSMGNVSAASGAAKIVRGWNARYVILAGIAGGFGAAGVRLGDVVIADQVVGYEPGRVSAEGVMRRPEVYRTDFHLLTAAQQVQPDEWASAIRAPRPVTGQLPFAHVGTVLSGEKVIADPHAVADLRGSWPTALAVEMESFGSALATYQLGGRFIVVKGVSDFADHAKDDRWRSYAAEGAARFVHAMLHHLASAGRSVQSSDLSVPGPVMLSVCWRLGDDWRMLAHYFRIPRHARYRFPAGEEPMAVWEWLEVRGFLPELPLALAFIGRPDLAGWLLDGNGLAEG